MLNAGIAVLRLATDREVVLIAKVARRRDHGHRTAVDGVCSLSSYAHRARRCNGVIALRHVESTG